MKVTNKNEVSGGLSTVDYDPFAGAEVSRVVPTTEPQREIWLADQISKEASLAYNESISLNIFGALNIDALKGALGDLTKRHDALRSTIGANGESLQIATEINLAFAYCDHIQLSPDQRLVTLARAKRVAVEEVFNLEAGPLFRAEIHRVELAKHVLILTAHHILCDGWSFGVLVRELAYFYSTRIGRPLPPLEGAPSYAEYAESQNAQLGHEQNVSDENYWLSQFRQSIPVLDLPIDRPRSTWRTFRSERIDLTFDSALITDVRKFGAGNGAGLFGTMLAGFAATLYRIAGADDLVIGIPAAGQSAAGYDRLVGHCVNLLPLRLKIDPASKMESLVVSTQAALLDAYEHQSFTFGSLLKKLSIVRDTSRLPLVNVIFNIDQAPDSDAAEFPDLRVETETNPRSFENFELFINAVPTQQGLRLECQYNADLFDGTTIERFIQHFECLMRAATKFNVDSVSKLPILTNEQRTALLSRHPGKCEFPVNHCLHELFSIQARKRGDHIAVSCDGQTITYDQLEERSNRLANRLTRMGVGVNVLVGVYLERSVDLLVAILGILKSGAAYLPLDPSYPAERVAFILDDATSPVLLSQSSLVGRLPKMNAQLLQIDAHWSEIANESALPAFDVARDPSQRAYVIYTSGSTGKPKGVEITHANVVRLFAATDDWYGFGAQDVWTMFHSYAFDFSVWEIWGALIHGGRLVVVPYLTSRSPDAFHELLVNERITVLNQTPSAFHQLIAADQNAPPSHKLSLRYVIFGGEALDTRSLKPWYERHAEDAPTLINMYGITETTVHVTYRVLTRADSELTSSPIGEPIADLSLYLLDEHLEPVPIGVAGELHIGGAGLARGYLNRSELSAARFIRDPFSNKPGARLYKSGDVARYRSNGNLEFIGRSDSQVKVRGHRIELGEIDARLVTYSGVAQSLTIVREDRPGDVRLVSYVVFILGTTASDEDLKTYLKKTLPEYMVPPHFIALPAIPLTENGKTDRKALPAPSSVMKSKAELVAPRNDLEAQVLAEMELSLGLPGVSIHDDFFAMGGHSLLAAQLTSRLNVAFKTHLSMRHLFEAPTVAKLAALIEAGEGSQRIQIVRRNERSSAPLSIMQERMWFMEQLYPGRVTYNGPSAHRLTGVLDESAFERAFNEMIWRQPSLRTSFAEEAGSVVQHIHDNVKISLFPAEDLSAISEADRESSLMVRLQQLTDTTFDLRVAPLFKAYMFKLANDQHVLFFMAHHIIWDGWSFDLLYIELSNLYAAFRQGKASPLPQLAVDYGDFASWHRQWMQGDELDAQLKFWRARLHEIDLARELPTDKPRRPGMSGVGKTELIAVEKPKADALHQIASGLDTTLFVVTISIYVAMLHGFSRQQNLVVGTPVRGRNSIELESIMGFFNTLLPLPVVVDPDESFGKLVGRMRAAVMQGLKHPDVPLEQLSQELSSSHSKKRGVLYQALFSFQDARQRLTKWGNLSHEMFFIFQRGAAEDLGMWLVELEDGLYGGVTYNTELFNAETVQALRDGYLSILNQVIISLETPVHMLAMPLRQLANAAYVDDASLASAPLPVALQAEEKPQTDTEKLLAEIWRAELKLPSIMIRDNFFDLGGHSLSAMQVMARMEKSTGKRINPQRFIFETLAQISKAYDETEMPVVEKTGTVKRLFTKLIGKKP
jgi:amino acid adenylation domain-containing protein